MEELSPLYADSVLPGYLPMPRAILDWPLSPTAMLLYGVLLDRSTLSQKNNYVNQLGQVYVIYTQEHLAQRLHKSTRRISACLKELEEAGFIRRERLGFDSPSRIFLSIPTGNILPVTADQNVRWDRKDSSAVTGRIRLPNDLIKQPDFINLYQQYSEGESL